MNGTALLGGIFSKNIEKYILRTGPAGGSAACRSASVAAGGFISRSQGPVVSDMTRGRA